MIKILREIKQLSQTEMSVILGMSQAKYARIEGGMAFFSDSERAKFCEVIGVSENILNIKVNAGYVLHREKTGVNLSTFTRMENIANIFVNMFHNDLFDRSRDIGYDCDIVDTVLNIKSSFNCENICNDSLYEIVENMGIPLLEFNFGSNTLSSFTYFNNEDKLAIFINRQLNQDDKRFAIAHELGHIFLGHKFNDKSIDKQADKFAINFLLPYNINNYFNSVYFKDCENLETWFDLKRKVRVSVKHLVEYAYDCKYINASQYRKLKLMLSPYSKLEPVSFEEVVIDKYNSFLNTL